MCSDLVLNKDVYIGLDQACYPPAYQCTLYTSSHVAVVS